MPMPFGPFDQTDIQSIMQRHCRRVTLPLDRRFGLVCGGARPVGLGFCPILFIFGALIPDIRTHPKLVKLIRNK